MHIEWLPERKDIDPPDDDMPEESWDVFTDPDYLMELEWELENVLPEGKYTAEGAQTSL